MDHSLILHSLIPGFEIGIRRLVFCAGGEVVCVT